MRFGRSQSFSTGRIVRVMSVLCAAIPQIATNQMGYLEGGSISRST